MERSHPKNPSTVQAEIIYNMCLAETSEQEGVSLNQYIVSLLSSVT